jgi:hypothetical protein
MTTGGTPKEEHERTAMGERPCKRDDRLIKSFDQPAQKI